MTEIVAAIHGIAISLKLIASALKDINDTLEIIDERLRSASGYDIAEVIERKVIGQ